MTRILKSSISTFARTGVILLILAATFLGGAATAYAQETETEDFEDIYRENVEECAVAAITEMLLQYALSFVSQQVPTLDWSTALKEHLGDCLIVGLKQAMIEDMTNQSISWVQTGYNGNPGFVQNLGQYYREIADSIAGSFIEETVPFLCSPFQLDIQLALTNLYRTPSSAEYLRNTSCRLSDTIENIEDFANGDFISGGWNGWYAYITEPYGNPLSSYINLSDDLTARISSARGQAEFKLGVGGGFFSKEVQTCYAVVNGAPVEIEEEGIGTTPGATEYYCDEPKIITPGDTIKTGLENIFKANLDTIVAADEINEILSIAVWYVLNDVLTGEEGLAGYSRDDFEHGGDIEPGTDPNGGGGGVDEDPDPGVAGESVCFVLNEFVPSQAQPNATFGMNLPNRSEYYKKIVVEMDVVNNGWYDKTPQNNQDNIHHSIFYLTRDNSWGSTFGYSWAGDEGSFLIRQRVATGDVDTRPNYLLPSGTTHFTYTFDTNTDRSGVVISRNNRILRSLAGPAVTLDSINTGGKDFFVELGFSDTSPNPNEHPSLEWRYENVRIQFLAEGDNSVGGCTPMNGPR